MPYADPKKRLEWARRRRKTRRALGLPSWVANGYTPAGYAKCVERDRLRRHTSLKRRQQVREAGVKQHEKLKRLYGGSPDQNVVARAKWLDARERKGYNLAHEYESPGPQRNLDCCP